LFVAEIYNYKFNLATTEITMKISDNNYLYFESLLNRKQLYSVVSIPYVIRSIINIDNFSGLQSEELEFQTLSD
jgi:hypothetical protein